MGTPVSKGGSGIIDGNPAIMRFLGKPDFCGPGSYIDEATKASEVNCELVEFWGEDHKLLLKKTKNVPGWEGFNNLQHKYCVVT